MPPGRISPAARVPFATRPSPATADTAAEPPPRSMEAPPTSVSVTSPRIRPVNAPAAEPVRRSSADSAAEFVTSPSPAREATVCEPPAKSRMPSPDTVSAVVSGSTFVIAGGVSYSFTPHFFMR